MSSDQAQPGSPSRPSKETNSVEAAAAVTQEDGEIPERVLERVLEFQREYPELAETPLSEAHGRKLRRIVTESDWSTEWVEGDTPMENAFAVSELDRREAATWLDAVHAFLEAHEEYDGMLARFANTEGDTFDVPLVDAWGETYSRKQYARARALQRQMGGGERPTGGEAVANWGSPATAMLTFTASSVGLSPIDHLDAIHDAFSYDGVRDTLRNTMEYHLGLDPEQWGYWAQAEPHGMGAADGDGEPGVNACFTHLHVGVYFDSEATATSLRSVGSELERVIDKHVDVCDPAGFDAHDYINIDDYLLDDDGCISLNGDVDNLGSYLAAYMGGYTEDLLDKPVEYLAWGALYWSAARRRTSRSKIVNEAIRADRCDQRAESEQASQEHHHGEQLSWNDGRGLDVVCSYCESGWSIDQARLDEPTTDQELSDELDGFEPPESPEMDLRQRWPEADSAWFVGETLRETNIRNDVADYAEIHGTDVSVPRLLAHLGINPTYRGLVEDVLAGETEVPSGSFDREPLRPEWELVAIVDSDGEEHKPGGGGVDMAPLELPKELLLSETRLRHDLRSGERFRCQKCNFSIHHPAAMASHLLDHGADTVKHAEFLLGVDDHHNHERPCMECPVDAPV